jgi:hypothetical protein
LCFYQSDVDCCRNHHVNELRPIFIAVDDRGVYSF